jgi:hypothetical protein
MKRLLVPVFGVISLAASVSAHAQIPGWSTSTPSSYADDRQPYYESRRAAYDNGYREGTKQGEKDGRKRAVYSYQDDRTWQRADKGYNRSFGDFERYRQSFRAGYGEGYADGYRRYAPDYAYGGYGRAIPRDRYPDVYPNRGSYPGSYPGGYGYPDQNRYPGGGYGNPGQYGYGNAAYTNGLNDGFKKGREDLDKRRSYDPLRHDWYRSGDHDYRGDYGPKDRYRDVYRQAFKEGYDRAYRGGVYR